MKKLDFPKEGMKSMPARSQNGEAKELPLNTAHFAKGGSIDPHMHSVGHANCKMKSGGAWSPSLGSSPRS